MTPEVFMTFASPVIILIAQQTTAYLQKRDLDRKHEAAIDAARATATLLEASNAKASADLAKNTALTQKALDGANRAYNEANDVNLKIKQLGIDLKNGDIKATDH